MKKKAKQTIRKKKEIKTGVLPRKESRVRLKGNLGYLLALLIISLLAFWSLTIDSRIYTQGDNINDAVYYNQVNQFYQQSGEVARWNPYIFGGVPNIFNLPKSALTFDFYLEAISHSLSLPFVFFWIGAMGMFFLLRHLEFDRLQSFFGSLVFLLAPFYKSLVINGHGTKIQAIMYAPWIFWALFRLLKDRKWINVLFLALFAGLQIRTSHYQVVFYTAILSLIFILSNLVTGIRRGSGIPLKQLLLIGIAGIGALLISSRPLLLAASYAGDSIRGREVVRLNDPNPDVAALDRGVSKRFVSNWSFTPSELVTLLVARAKGGTSSEYFGDARSMGFRQDIIPGYWGHSPYNGSYYYMGSFVFLLMIAAFVWVKKNPVLWSLGIGLLVMMIWSLGTFAGPIYDLSYSLVPFFSNFRTPTTSMAMVYLLTAIIATYGLRSLTYYGGKEMKKFWQVLGAGLAVLALLFIIGTGASYVNSRQTYDQNVLEMLIEARRSMFFKDLAMLGGSLVLFIGCLWLFIKNKLDLKTTISALLILSTIDLFLVWNHYGDETMSRAEFNRTFLGDSQTTSYLKSDQEIFRVFALGNMNFGLPAHVQTIGGGYDMQMNKSLYELTNNNLYEKVDGRNQINWNVLDFMNVKYIVTDRQLDDEHLNQEIVDQAKGLYTYRYKFDKQRGFFVDDYQVISDPVARMRMINSKAFDARRTAILEESPKQQLFPASRSTVDLISFDPNKVVYTVQTSNPGLFVLSDIYQPKMQEIFIDGEKIDEVYKTNHTIQSVIVPAGLHTIELRYVKSLFGISKWISNISFLIVYLLLAFIIYHKIRKPAKQPARV
ncbi:MAG: hypothetical protein KDC80_07815 [Saprospiraceae bacterium]|nr:hypothetical protein [Saprospiraceae bacterium]